VRGIVIEPIIEQLLASDEPSIRYKVRAGVLGEDPASPALQVLREEVRTSPRVMKLLAERRDNGTIPGSVYQKWKGAHWVLAVLADLGYPAGDAALAPLVDQVCACWLSERHVESVPIINGRARRCASQESNALNAMLTLGFYDARADLLVDNLLRWQWPDGGWNCARALDASVSSFHETWIPLRALARYARVTGHQGAQQAVDRAAEVFLSRRLFRRRRDGRVMKSEFLQLIYPPYWHYTILNGLKVMAEIGRINDPRCAEALDVLEGKRLPDGGFPAERTYYTTQRSTSKGNSLVDWGGKHADRMNPWVTADALSVLKAAGRR
jgi:hypothetical protein